MTVTLHHGNCLDILPTLTDCSVDSIVTDPPYELGFMGKKWDNSGIAYNADLWAECLRVLKPGGHLLAFGGTRTYHRMSVAIEDAGFEIRDSLHWIYGSGFPKSLDVSKAIDKQRDEDKNPRVYVTTWTAEQCEALGWNRRRLCEAFGVKNQPIQSWTERNADYAIIPTWDNWLKLKNLVGFGDEMDAEVWRLNGRKGQPGENWDKREVLGTKTQNMTEESTWATMSASGMFKVGEKTWDITAPATEQAKEWQGWGTALKPAHEPIVVARKPLVGTVASNVLQWGTGAINIDGTRVATSDSFGGGAKGTSGFAAGYEHDGWKPGSPAGRWPANIILTHNHNCTNTCTDGCPILKLDTQQEGASRYFTVTEWDVPFRYVAKPGKKERNAGLDALPEQKWKGNYGDGIQDNRPHTREGYVYESTTRNHHPTVKPLALMRWLVRLVTPPDGTVLEPFAGSGTTLVACHLENLNAIGIEMTDEYLPIIEGRVAWAEQEANKQQEELDL